MSSRSSYCTAADTAAARLLMRLLLGCSQTVAAGSTAGSGSADACGSTVRVARVPLIRERPRWWAAKIGSMRQKTTS